MSLYNYTQAAKTELFNSTGAFFAFGNKQFDEAKKEGVKYVSMGAGLVCPKENAQELSYGLDVIQAAGIKVDLAENGVKKIIHRELANYETQLTNDISDTVYALSDYGITKEQIAAEYPEYYNLCIENEWF